MADSNSTLLTVVRHGETVWNRIGRQQGWLDTELTELGRAQAKAIAGALAGREFDAIYSSDLGRAMRTAEIIAAVLGMEVVPSSGLRERNLGILQALTMAEFRQKHPGEYERFASGEADYRLPGGESIRDRYDRHVACAQELAARHPGEGACFWSSMAGC
jgi:probable phosphoglycerate mutase